MGSVKDLKIILEAKGDYLGKGFFNFSDRFSVFDWGEMPNQVPFKGAALALMGAKSFELLESVGINSHYNGLVENNYVRRMDELKSPSNVMSVELTRVIKPIYANGVYDYSYFKQNQGKLDNYLIPLECIYRNGLPKGSSIFKKLESGKLSLSELGFKTMPKEGDMLPKPLYDFSTKLEESGDRMIKNKDELFAVSGLTEEEFSGLEKKIKLANELITKQCDKAGLINWDGKFEFMKYLGKIRFVDVLGTPDECRFSVGKVQVSKEVIRQWYKKIQPEWALSIDKYKEKFNLEWKEAMIKDCLMPVPLPNTFLRLVSEMYASCANEYCEKKFFDVPKLSEVINELKETGCAIYVA